MEGGKTTKAAGGRKGSSKRKAAVTKSVKVGLQFPVGRITGFLKQGRYMRWLGTGAPVYLAVALKYLEVEALELAGNAARDNKKSCIILKHVLLVLRNDEEFGKFLAGVTISSGGVLPNINSVHLPKKSDKGKYDEALKSPKKD